MSVKSTINPLCGILGGQTNHGDSRLLKKALYITAERRMGKTSVVRDKMGQTVPDGWQLIYLDVSKAVSPLQFVQALLDKSKPYLDTGPKAKIFIAEWVAKIQGLEIKAGVGVKLPENLAPDWKRLLESLLRDITNLDQRIVLAFDELPLMLDAIKRREGGVAGEALIMELLDTLRAARQENPRLRMIYTGSLGLHHVLTILREQGYQNDPINDMASIDLEPLSEEDATELALRLFHGEKIAGENVEFVALHLARETAGIPFYIQHIVADMALEEGVGTTEGIDRCLKQRLTDPRDPWRLNYHNERIDTHYPETYRPIARSVLDQLAMGEAKTLQELMEGIDSVRVTRDLETVRKALTLLGLDHYTNVDEGKYRFNNSFLLRVWRSRREA